MKKLFLLSATLFLILCSACSKDSEPKSNEGGNNPSNMILGTWRLTTSEYWYEKKSNTSKFGYEVYQDDDEEYTFKENGKGCGKEYDKTTGNVRDSWDINYSFSGSILTIIEPDGDKNTLTIDKLTSTKLILREQTTSSMSGYDYEISVHTYNKTN